MKTYVAVFLISLLYLSLSLAGCQDEDNEDAPMEEMPSDTTEEKPIRDSLMSKNGLKESHENGANCMSCHGNGGSAIAKFKIAGSVFNEAGTEPEPDGQIRIYTAPQGGGELLASLEVDGLGNFYTTERIDLTGGAYPSVEGRSGRIQYMGSRITQGQCNGCHGSNQEPIWVD